MNYWESHAWLVILALWLAVLSFSRDRVARNVAVGFLVAYNLAPIMLDQIPATASEKTWGLTVNALLAMAALWYLGKKNRLALCCAYLLAIASMFGFFLAEITPQYSPLSDALFFPIAYALEFLIVLLSMGFRFERSRFLHLGGTLGHYFSQPGGRH